MRITKSNQEKNKKENYKKILKRVKKEVKAITLIALVVTIIVLLILAGVAINLTVGDNGLFRRVQNAVDTWQKSDDIEKINLAILEAQIGENGYNKLDQNNLQDAITNQFSGRNVVITDNGNETFTVSCLDTLKDYTISENEVKEYIDWNEAMANAVAPSSQDDARNEGVIGIGTDGKPVDMDLWMFTKIDNGYALSFEDSLGDEKENRKAAYLGKFDENGAIEGNIPVYIKENDSEKFIPVTSLRDTFFGLGELKIAPKLPNTIESLFETFQDCISLTEPPYIPSNVKDMTSTFFNCQNLDVIHDIPNKVETLNYCFYNCNISELDISLGKNVKTMMSTFFSCKNLTIIESELPLTVTNLSQTFAYCSKLINAPEIPYGVKSMSGCFQYCESLEKAPTVIPKTVSNFQWAFQNCLVLTGTIEINGCSGKILENGYADYNGCFLGACNENKLIVTRKTEDSLLEEIIKDANNSNITY